MSAVRELNNVLQMVRNKITQPPEAYRFREAHGNRTAFVKPNERIMVKAGNAAEARDLRTAFNKRVIGRIWPAADGLGDLCYNEHDMGFYIWTGIDWYCYGFRG